jgi:UDP-N-acetylmuramoylalanine--D-glutamate ligase
MSRLADWHEGRKYVAVAGMGRSGVAVTRLLAAHDIPVYLSDASVDRVDAAQALERQFPGLVTAEAGGHDLPRVAGAAALILSPGIPPTAPVVLAATEAGLPILAEAEVALEELEGLPYLAVTGTNGKTTTTALIDHLLREAGRSSMAAGNIGTPLSMVAAQHRRPAWLAVELSSFQLHDMPSVRPTVGVLTNLAADHLDRYPDFADYVADKALLFRNADARSITVSNLDDPSSRPLVAAVPGRHLAFSLRVPADAWFDRTRGVLMLAGGELLSRDRFPLLGDHNVANALAAALAVHATGVSVEAIRRGLSSFGALPHRMEVLGAFDGITYINDSKATNVASTQVALAAMTQPYVLLLGGRHKGEPYTVLLEELQRLAVAVVVFGEAAELIEADLAAAVRCERAEGFPDAVRLAAALAPVGGAVLLSPACSSYDMFANYEERGAAFRSIAEGA